MNFSVVGKIPLIVETFKRINANVFSNNLILPEFEIRRMDWWAYADRRPDDTEAGIIFVNVAFPNSATFRNALCREMAHLYQIQLLDEPRNNGPSFEGWILPCKKGGFDIADVYVREI